MIIIRLAGGLGNQIFQLGAGLLLAKRSNIKKIILDDSALSKYKAKRENKLLSFFDFNKLDIDIEFKNIWIIKLRLPKLVSYNFIKNIFVSDKNFKTVIQNPNKKLLVLDGYFQWELSQDNFDNIVVLLKNIFISQDATINKDNVCVVHIRGGDFVKLGWNKITPKEYYLEAMKIMVEKYNINEFIIITDDKEYAKTILNQVNYKYEFKCSSMQNDFYEITLSSNRILSSSTFALWASALGNNDDGKVIAPQYWFPNQKRDIFLKNETRL